MSLNIESRFRYLQELNEFISSSHSSMEGVCEKLGWSLNFIKNQIPTTRCPINHGHYVAEDRIQEHVQSCQWRSEGYSSSVATLPDSCNLPNVKSVTIDSALVEDIIKEAVLKDPSIQTVSIRSLGLGTSGIKNRPVPQTSDRLFSDFTSDERLAIYDYVIAQTGASESLKLEDLQLPFEAEKKNEPKSALELLAEERDAKRRRISHRSKKVSTNRKSHTEVIREVIQNQMEMYEAWLKKDSDEVENNGETVNVTIKQEPQDEWMRREKKQARSRSRTRSEVEGRKDSRDTSAEIPNTTNVSSNRDHYYSHRRDRSTDDINYYHREKQRSRKEDYGDDRYNSRNKDGHSSRKDKYERQYRSRYDDDGRRHRDRETDHRRDSRGTEHVRDAEIHRSVSSSSRGQFGTNLNEKSNCDLYSNHRESVKFKNIHQGPRHKDFHELEIDDLGESYKKSTLTTEEGYLHDLHQVHSKKKLRQDSPAMDTTFAAKTYSQETCNPTDYSDKDYLISYKRHKVKKEKKRKHKKRKKHSKKSSSAQPSESDSTHLSDFSC